MSDRIESYLNIAGEQIRWKRAKPVLLEELRTHLLDQRDACLAEGMSEEEAQAEAVLQMGDAVSVGQGLDRVHRPKPQWGLLFLTVAVAAAGVVFRLFLTINFPWQIASDGVPRTVLALLLSVAALFGAYFLDYTFLGRHGKELYVIALVLGVWMILAQGFSLGYYLSFVSVFYPLVYGAWVYSWRGSQWKGFFLSMLGMVPLLAILVLSGKGGLMFDLLALFGTGVLLLVLLAWKDWYGVGRKAGLGLLGAGLLLLVVLGNVRVLTSDYMTRMLLYGFHPELDPQGYGYTGVNIQQALSSAHWMGQGEWSGIYPYEWMMPGSLGDYFLTTTIFKLGWGPFLALIFAFFLMTICILVKCLRQKNTLAKLTVLAIVIPMVLRTVVGLAMNLGIVILHANFPLFSADMVLLTDMALIGVALSVFRQENLPQVSGKAAPDWKKLLRFIQ